MIEWLNMDGDGVYVWPCYILTFIVLVANVWVARSQHSALLQRATARARHSATQSSTTEELHHDSTA